MVVVQFNGFVSVVSGDLVVPGLVFGLKPQNENHEANQKQEPGLNQ